MYSEKVMELFKKPHNLGRMKNPDGVGKVGNPICLTPEIKIQLNGHLKGISDIEGSSSVLTHMGSYHNVLDTSKREYKGEIIHLRNKLGDISVTPEHLILAVKVPKKRKYFDYVVKKTLVPSWYHAQDIEERDVVLYPVLKKTIDVKEIPLKVEKKKLDYKSFDLPKKIKLDAEFLRLCGYYLSEGHVCTKVTKSHVSFTFNIKETSYYEDVVNIVKNKFGLKPKVKLVPSRKTAYVYVYSAPLARFFENLLGKGAPNKRMPHFMMLLPPSKQAHIMIGLWRGDGYIDMKREYPRAGYSTISSELANQIKIILMRLNIVPSIYREEAKIRKNVSHKRSYRIHVGDKESLRKLCKLLNAKFDYSKPEKTHSWFDNNYLYTPITKKQNIDYSGFVYNLEVEKAHSFTTDAFCVHNCGDVMYIYIRVKDNILKDIKFETFGCAAAIATSSMITDLAKGKTLEEALKISRENVAQEVGGLPPIKLHCSNLAADALHEAIKDYLKKKGKK